MLHARQQLHSRLVQATPSALVLHASQHMRSLLIHAEQSASVLHVARCPRDCPESCSGGGPNISRGHVAVDCRITALPAPAPLSLCVSQAGEQGSGGELELAPRLSSMGSFRAASPGPSLSRQVCCWLPAVVRSWAAVQSTDISP